MAMSASDVPRDIAFLEAHGLGRTLLEGAAECALAWDVAAADALLASGGVTPEAFYRALAAELNLPFLDPGFLVHPLARYPAAILSGIAPLTDGNGARYVLAPRGASIAGLLARRARWSSGSP